MHSRNRRKIKTEKTTGGGNGRGMVPDETKAHGNATLRAPLGRREAAAEAAAKVASPVHGATAAIAMNGENPQR